jgi:hypothetical protein
VERRLPVGVAHLRPQVPAVDVDELLDGQYPQPQEERHRRAGGVLRQPPCQDEVRLLEDVGGVDAGLEAAVEAQPDHPPEPVPVAGEQLGHRRVAAPPGAADGLDAAETAFRVEALPASFSGL